MIKRLVATSLRRPALAVVIAVGVLLVGFVQLDQIEVDTLPEFVPPIVEVQTEALGLSAPEVEQLITVPLEADLLNGVAWVESIRSESLPGLSSIVMTFEPGTDLLRARQVVQERLTQAAGLPNVSRAPAMIQPLSSESRVMMVGLSSDDVSLIDMSVLARWTIRPFLMGVNGVANVSVWGQRERQLQVQVDQEELVAAGVALLDVVKTTGNALWVSPLSFLEASTPGTGGFIDGPNQRIGIQHVLGIENADDLAAVPLDGNEDLTLGDVTTVVEDHQPLIGDAVVDDGPGLLLVIEKFPWSNTGDTTQAVEDALDELAPGLTGITVDADLFRPADYVDRSINNWRTAMIAGFVLVLIAVFALVARWRAALVGVLSMLVSIVGTGLVLWAFGVEVNTMVLAGFVLATAFLIDDSIGDASTMQRRLARRGEDPAETTIVKAIVDNQGLLLFVSTALALAIVPVFVMDGAAGEFLPTVGVTMLVTIAVSLLVSSLITPSLGLLLLSSETDPGERSLMRRAQKAFGGFTSVMSRSRWSGVIAALALVVLGAAMVPTLNRQYVPDFEQTDLLISMDGAAGTSLQASRRIATSAAAEIRAIPAVDDVGAHIGRAILSDSTVNVNSSELWVSIDPDADFGATIDSIQEIVTGYPGYGAPGAVTYSNQRVNDVLRQPTHDLVVRVYGEDPEVLGPLAEEMEDLVDGIAGTENVRAVQPLLEPAVEIEVDISRAAEFGVKPGDVRRTAATILSGIEVGSFFEEQKVFEVVVWSAPEARDSVTAVENLLIDTPTGDSVQLSEIADVRVAPVESVILRDAVSRYIDVVADVSGRNVESVENDVTEAVKARGLPFEYHVRILDDHSDSASNQRTVIGVTVAVAIAILLILQAAFGSWRTATILFVATPLAIAGGLVTLAISGGTYSIGSSIGLFAIYGITLRNAVLLVGTFDSLQLEDAMAPGPELAAACVRERFAPTVTSLVAIAMTMIPIVVMGERAGFEVIRPLAIVVLGGLVTSAIVTLVVLPAVHSRFAGAAIPRKTFAEI